ncbi:MAG: hypothetical protein K1000chlam1_00872, partial [Candidatus Anoxychlamydiales bacterium]|nr:hypothetical protein [Candidatus Anoxychlamydiales bacterium]
FKRFTTEIISRLSPSPLDTDKLARTARKITDQAMNLKDHIDKFCNKRANSDLMGFVQYIDDRIKSK